MFDCEYAMCKSGSEAATREAGSRIVAARAWACDVPVLTPRTDVIQSLLSQETIFVELTTRDGVSGRGYAYTIGTGGTAVWALLEDYLPDKLIDLDASSPETIRRRRHALSRSLMVGPATAPALAAIDIAVWDARTTQSIHPTEPEFR
jgi:L-alanine-DL-glutamate epimerase-like enolase superfamily enzyme